MTSNTYRIELLKNEKLEFKGQEDSKNTSLTNEEINSKYVKGEVRIVTEQARYPLDSIVLMLEGGKYDRNPEFQRRFRWSVEKQSRLIESFIMNVPIPPIFLYEDEYSHYEVMDGLQRLTAVYEFYKNRFPLSDLNEWAELNGRRYDELPTQIKRGIDRRYLSSIILLQETAKSDEEAQRLKQLVFERINSGGERLEGQESRNAIYNGPLNQLCLRLSRNKYLCRAWGIPEPTSDELRGGDPEKEVLKNKRYKKMEDVELVLRFFAFRQRTEHNWDSLTGYLDQYLQYGNKYSDDILEKLQDIFEETIQLTYKIFEENTFRIQRESRANNNNWNWSSSPSKVAYDAMMYVFSQYLDKSDLMISSKDKFQEKIIPFYQENSDKFAGRDVNRRDFDDRVFLFQQFVDNVLNLE